ncbi:MAG: helix-turn-helix transcriptional regulator [Solirubrobacteraceae bacterium]
MDYSSAGSPVTSLAIATVKRSDRFDSADRIALINGLVPHLQQALRLRGRLEELDHRSGDLAAAGEAVGHGIVIVAAGRRSVYINSAADSILRSNDGLRIHRGCLEADASRADAQLQVGVARALNPDSRDIWGGSFLCPRPSGRRPFVVHVAPIDPTTVATPQDGRAIIVIIDPEGQPEPPATLLRRLYGLTRSEADVALLVMRGEGLKPIADELSVSVNTVRTHLQNVFDKTGTSRQAELVRLLIPLYPLRR